MIKKKLINQYDIRILEKFKSGAGFTLIELLVVMAIIGVLASLILLNIPASLGRARDAQRKNDLKQIQTALQLYYNDYGHYPTTGAAWVNSIGMNGGTWIPGLGPSYIKTMPYDPKNSGCLAGADPNPSFNCFTYSYYSGDTFCNLGGANQNYILVALLEQYPNDDLSQKTWYNPDGSVCAIWAPNKKVGVYTVSNP